MIRIAGALLSPVPLSNVVFKFPLLSRAISTPPGKNIETQSLPLHLTGSTPVTKFDAPRMLYVFAEKYTHILDTGRNCSNGILIGASPAKTDTDERGW